MPNSYNGIEMLIIEAARQLKDKEIVFAGVGLPIMAVGVAKQVYNKDITIICESGTIDTFPSRLILSVADLIMAQNSSAIYTVNEVFSYILQGGHIDVGLLGGAQVDKFGNLNSTVIGDYIYPNVRMPGSGGACEIASLAYRTIILMPQNLRRFVNKVDFITSPGHLSNINSRKKKVSYGGGPFAVVSDLGVYNFNSSTKEMYLKAKHQNVPLNLIYDNTGWPLNVAHDLHETALPSREELDFIRKLDPAGIFLGKAG